jgi:ferric-dicitrate binding protein FerR (iron transport regulator)
MSNQHNNRPLGQDFGWELEQLRAETQARSSEVAAVHLRLRGASTAAPPWWQLWRPAAPIGIGGLALAAALVWLLVRPVSPQTQELDLVSAEWTREQVHQDVQLHFEGRGELAATGKTHDITWQEGLLKVSVTPEQDIQLNVKTPEAMVSVVGTVFAVDRDLTGTTVSVERGRVSVRCGAGEAHLLQPEDGPMFCQTTSPAGLAVLTRERVEAGDNEGALLVSAEGLSLAPPNSYATADLHWQRTIVFMKQRDWPMALSSAELLLETGQSSFAVSGHQAAALAGRESGGCDSAQPHLHWLADAGEASPTELAHLADCTAASDPEQAAAWLQDALGAAEDPALQTQLQQRLDQLRR